jgi:uncharacterized membrane protein YczE
VLRRLPRLVLSLVGIGVAIALMVRADLGLSPWDVLHQGISERTGVPIGTVGIAVGFVVLLAWIPLRERIGLATVLNVLILGVSIDVALALLPETSNLEVRWAELLVGIFAIGPGCALYLSVGLGAGPRDGVMTALVDRGHSMRAIRTAMEVAVLVAGWLLGGTVGIGTVLFALTVGPNMHWFTDRVKLREPDPAVPVALAD